MFSACGMLPTGVSPSAQRRRTFVPRAPHPRGVQTWRGAAGLEAELLRCSHRSRFPPNQVLRRGREGGGRRIGSWRAGGKSSLCSSQAGSAFPVLGAGGRGVCVCVCVCVCVSEWECGGVGSQSCRERVEEW